jgi:hypothetical protein
VQTYVPRPSTLVEAEIVTTQNVDELVVICSGIKVVNGVTKKTPNGTSVSIVIETMVGVRRIKEGDYLVKDPNGQFHGEPAETFEAKFVQTTP